MTDIANERFVVIAAAGQIKHAVCAFITEKHIVPGKWPNGFSMAEEYSRGIALLGSIQSVKVSAKMLAVESVVVDTMVDLYEPLKDYLCGLEVLLNKFPLMYRLPTGEEGEHEEEEI